MRSLGIGQVRLHNFSLALPFVTGGNAVRFVFLCFFRSGSCPLPFFWQSPLLLRAGFCETFSGANFCFCSFFGSVCFWYGFAYGFRVFFRGNVLKEFS